MAPRTWPNMQYLLPITATDRYSLSTKLTGNIWDKLSSVFSVFLPSKPEWQSCISWWNHAYIQYGSLNCTKICCICPLITVQYRIPQNSMKTEIPRKWANSAAWLKISRSAENCGPCLSLQCTVCGYEVLSACWWLCCIVIVCIVLVALCIRHLGVTDRYLIRNGIIDCNTDWYCVVVSFA